MRYRSTRAPFPAPLVSFEDAVRQGLAPDGGLYVPAELPQLPPLRNLLPSLLSASGESPSFNKVAFVAFRPFISQDEISDADLADLIERSFATFSHELVTPLVRIASAPFATDESSSASVPNLRILELFHGPTFAFKDVALQFLANLFDRFLRQENAKKPQKPSRIAVVAATSGDTGGAAIYALRRRPNIDVFVLHPHNRISPVQERQMTSVLDPNVHNIALKGSFDDCQDIVKALLSDADFKSKYSLAAVNSINWARILAQTSYYLYAVLTVIRESAPKTAFESPESWDNYAAQCQAKGQHAIPPIQFSVPTGNFGDILAGFYVRSMGIPIHRFIIATNENDILYRFMQTSVYAKDAAMTATDSSTASHQNGSDLVKQTLAPAMDILVSSNFERLLWYLHGSSSLDPHDLVAFVADPSRTRTATDQVRDLMTKLKRDGWFKVDHDVMTRMSHIFTAYRVNDAEIRDAIRRYYYARNDGDVKSGHGYILDPHTAVGIASAEQATTQYRDTHHPYTVCLATASPGKFPDVVMNAIRDGGNEIRYDEFAPKQLIETENMPVRMTRVGNGMDGIRHVIQCTLDAVE